MPDNMGVSYFALHESPTQLFFPSHSVIILSNINKILHLLYKAAILWLGFC